MTYFGSNLPIWPSLAYQDWKPTCETLQRWAQIIGKIRLSKTPWTNHSWNCTLYVTETGLGTSVVHERDRSFSIAFDFVTHHLRMITSDGRATALPLVAEPVASFYTRCKSALAHLGVQIDIFGRPNELPDAVPFAEDSVHCAYDPSAVQRFGQILRQCDRVMKEFRAHFIGKVSPVHFFWGSFDLAVTRFSGRRAPEHPGGVPHLPDLVTRDAYSHEVSSCGFWPGSAAFPQPAFYSYAYPKPADFELARVPEGAYFDSRLREFILPYEAVIKSQEPDLLIADFFQRTYEAAANLGKWDRPVLEESPYLSELQARHAS